MRFDFIGKNVVIHPTCDIDNRAAPYIHLGNGVRLGKDVWLNISHEASPSVKNKPIIRIGENTAVGRRCTISGINRIEIGSDIVFGPGVFMSDHNHEFSNPDMPISKQGATSGGTIIIEEGCWFGHNSAIISDHGRELRIGRNSVIGCNSVVTKSVPPYSVMVGSAARNIGLLPRSESKESPPSAD
jgi:acetyltransferase-like isoleucine patch superfamily enzyme